MMKILSLTDKEFDILMYYLDWKIWEINDSGNEFEYPQIEDIYTRLNDGFASNGHKEVITWWIKS